MADANGGLYDIKFQADHRLAAYNYCIANNPSCTWNVVGEVSFREPPHKRDDARESDNAAPADAQGQLD